MFSFFLVCRWSPNNREFEIRKHTIAPYSIIRIYLRAENSAIQKTALVLNARRLFILIDAKVYHELPLELYKIESHNKFQKQHLRIL